LLLKFSRLLIGQLDGFDGIEMLLRTRRGIWRDEVFEILDLPRSIMPELVNPGVIVGELFPGGESS
jgi:hypothetical protein